MSVIEWSGVALAVGKHRYGRRRYSVTRELGRAGRLGACRSAPLRSRVDESVWLGQAFCGKETVPELCLEVPVYCCCR